MTNKEKTNEQERSFLYKACCEEKNGKLYESCKRLAGISGWWICLFCIVIATAFELYFTHTISGTVSGLLMTVMASSTILIGAKTFVSMFQGNETKVVSDEKTHEEEE